MMKLLLKPFFCVATLAAGFFVSGDSVEALQDNEFRTVISLDGAWRVSAPLPVDRRPAPEAVPEIPGQWSEFSAPLNSFFVWAPRKVLPWDGANPPANPQQGTENAHGQTEAAKRLFAGKNSLVSICERVFEFEGGGASRWVLRLAGAAPYTTVRLNGEVLGTHVGAYTGFQFDVTGKLRKGENRLQLICTVPVGGEQLMNWGASIYFVSGPWRPVALLGLPGDSLAHPLIDSDVPGRKLTVRGSLDAPASRELEARAAVTGPDGVRRELGGVKIAPGACEFILTAPFDGATWSPEHPALQTLELTLLADGRPVDRRESRFGFRSIGFAGRELLLNGSPYRLYGYGCDGNYFGGEGYSPRELSERYRHLYTRYKEHFANAVRWHNPVVQEGFRAADEVGFALYQGWNNGCSARFHREFGDAVLPYIQEYVRENFNHPSILMWHFSNEEWDKAELPAARRIYDAVREVDRSGRPVAPDSGSYSFPWLPGEAGRTDMADIHNYCGTSFKALGGLQKRPFTMNHQVTGAIIENVEKLFGRPFPVIVGEAQAQVIWTRYDASGWSGTTPGGDHRRLFGADGKFRPEFLDELGSYSRSSWSDVGHNVRNAGLVAYFEPKHPRVTGLAGWTAVENWKRTFEDYRRLKLPAGFLNYGHLFHKPLDDSRQKWTITQLIFQPVLPVGLDFDRQPIAGDACRVKILIDRREGCAVRGDQLAARLEDRAGQVLAETVMPLGGQTEFDVTLAVPREADGRGILRLLVYDKGTVIGENFYYLSISRPVWRENAIVPAQKVWLWAAPGSHSGDVARIFESLKIPFEQNRLPELLKTAAVGDWIVVPPGAVSASGDWATALPGLRRALGAGTNLLVLEQSGELDLGLTPNSRLIQRDWNITADPVPAGGPLPDTLSWDKFWIWRGSDGILGSYVLPCNRNSLILAGAYDDDLVYSLLSAGRVGKGALVSSQLRAVERFDRDGGASLYLYELLRSAFSGRLAAGLLPWHGASNDIPVARRDLLRCLNLAGMFNRTWSDDIAKDGKGGWTDEGRNDFSHFAPPRGDAGFQEFQESYNRHIAGKAWLLGLPFDIPADGVTAPAAIVLGAGLPQRVEIPIGCSLKNLYLLGLATNGGQGKFTLRYADGADTVIPSAFPDWWSGKSSADAKVAWEGVNPKSSVRVKCFIQPILNTHPGKRIESLTLEGNNVVILAITVEEVPQK